MKIIGNLIDKLGNLYTQEKISQPVVTYGILAALLGIILLGSMHYLTTISANINAASPKIPVTSFVHLLVKGDFIMQAGICKEPAGCDIQEQTLNISSASGVKISEDKILTASHFCERFLEIETRKGEIDRDGDLLKDVHFVARDYTGRSHNLKVETLHRNSDLCIVSGKGIKGEIAKLSRTQPAQFERVWNVAAPQGIFFPSAPLLLEGFYNGRTYQIGIHLSIPAAPGSSGSPVFRSDGTLVSIIHSVHPTFQMSSYGSSIVDIRKIILASE